MVKVKFYSTTPEFEAYYNSLSKEGQEYIKEAFYAALSGGDRYKRFLERAKAKITNSVQAPSNEGTLQNSTEVLQKVDTIQEVTPVHTDETPKERRSLTFGELLCPTPDMLKEIWNEDPEFFERYYNIYDERKKNGESIRIVDILKAANASDYQAMLYHEYHNLVISYIEYEKYKESKKEGKAK